MPPFEDIGFLLMDVAKMCNVDAARIVTGDAIAASLAAPDQSGFHLVASEAFQAPDGTQARLLLLSMKRAPPHRPRADGAQGDGAARPDAARLGAAGGGSSPSPTHASAPCGPVPREPRRGFSVRA